MPGFDEGTRRRNQGAANMTLTTAVPLKKLREYSTPVVFSSSGQNIWHVPEINDGEVGYLCGSHKGRNRMMVSELSVYSRRRNPQMCQKCQYHAETDGYPDAGVLK
jgi:hypothetical protein